MFEDSRAANCYHFEMLLAVQMHFRQWKRVHVKLLAKVAAGLNKATATRTNCSSPYPLANSRKPAIGSRFAKYF